MNNSNSVVRDADGDSAQLRARVRELENKLQTEKMEVAGRLAGGIAHDLNNLLTPILAYGNMVMEDLPPDSPLREFMAEVVKAGDRALVMTKMLQGLRLKSAGLVPIDLHPAITGQLDRMKAELGADVEVKLVLGAGVSHVLGEAGGFERAIEELVRNAKLAMPAGGTITVRTRPVRERDADFIEVLVKDEGPGMASEVREHMFEPYFSTRPKGQGKGLGLAVAGAVVYRAGGFIRCNSEFGAGTEMLLFLPVG